MPNFLVTLNIPRATQDNQLMLVADTVPGLLNDVVSNASHYRKSHSIGTIYNEPYTIEIYFPDNSVLQLYVDVNNVVSLMGH